MPDEAIGTDSRPPGVRDLSPRRIRREPSYAAAVTTAEMIELAKRMGVEVTVSTAPPKTGEIALLPGLLLIPTTDEGRAK